MLSVWQNLSAVALKRQSLSVAELTAMLAAELLMEIAVMTYRAWFLILDHSDYVSGDYINRDDLEWPPANELVVLEVNPFGERGALRRKVVVCNGNRVEALLHVYVGVDELGFLLVQCFSHTLSNDRKVAFICGQHVHLFDIASQRTTSWFLQDYVSQLCPVPEYLETLTDDFLVATFEYVFLINVQRGIVWKSPQCGYDCVGVHRIEEGIVYGSGDWDPPYDARDFRLDLRTGQFIESPH
ncbi:hypothetical protein [Kosakonia sp.]|uniref:hypothetical protein n=1 Tax=Kosakonia sp. TaxID=1916651 RepID=UPI00289B3211|nr:hypothetical protein [Kosakonia sp.]